MHGAADLVWLATDTSRIAEARRHVRRCVADLAGPDALADLELTTSELVTSTIEHGEGDVLGLSVERSHDAVRVTVRSVGNVDGVAAPGDWAMSAAGGTSGRGLAIVNALADEVRVERTDDGLAITATTRFGGGADVPSAG